MGKSGKRGEGLSRGGGPEIVMLKLPNYWYPDIN